MPVKDYNLPIASVVCGIGAVIWKFCGITGNELLFTFVAVWSLPVTLGFAAGLTLYRNKLNIVPLVIAAALTTALPLWAFGVCYFAVTALTAFSTVLGMCVSSGFRKMFNKK